MEIHSEREKQLKGKQPERVRRKFGKGRVKMGEWRRGLGIVGY